MNGPNRVEPSSRTVTLGLSREVARQQAPSKAISCFPITSFLCVAQGGARATPSLSILTYKELGL